MRFRTLNARHLAIPAIVSLAIAGPAAIAAQPTAQLTAGQAGEGTDTEATNRFATTSPEEAERVDSVDVSGLAWGDCPAPPRGRPPMPQSTTTFSCATLDVPLDYSNPDDGTYKLFIKKAHASGSADQKKGALFLNPGGPGGSSSNFVPLAVTLFPENVQQSFDIIGVDPRGIAGSPAAKCFEDPKQARDFAMKTRALPLTEEDRTAYIEASDAWVEACQRPGNPIAAHASTANVARDLDVVRRAVGDEKLSYHGLSYGSVLGQQYAALFPDRFRALVIDGVVDGSDWVGTRHNSEHNLGIRIGSAAGAEVGLREIFDRCDEAGPEKCGFAVADDSPRSGHEEFLALYDRVTEKPITMKSKDVLGEYYPDDANPDAEMTIDKGRLTGLSMATLQMSFKTVEVLPVVAKNLKAALDKRDAEGGNEDGDNNDGGNENGDAVEAAASLPEIPTDRPTIEQPERTTGDGALLVMCSDAKLPGVGKAIDQALNSTRHYPVFGPMWAAAGIPCGSEKWQQDNNGAYTGPFYKHTATAPLVIGNRWDPATNHDQAVKVALRTPHAALISSDSWGHTALKSSKCVDDLVGEYLLTGEAPRFTRCTGDYQPFTDTVDTQQRQDVARLVTPVIGNDHLNLWETTTK